MTLVRILYRVRTSYEAMTTEKPKSESPDDDDVGHRRGVHEFEPGFYEDEKAKSKAARDRLYAAAKKPTIKAKSSPPKLTENDYIKLKDHVRMINGLSPRLIKKQRVVCWMDEPEIEPKSNWTREERDKRIRDRIEERKDDEEDAFSARCVN